MYTHCNPVCPLSSGCDWMTRIAAHARLSGIVVCSGIVVVCSGIVVVVCSGIVVVLSRIVVTSRIAVMSRIVIAAWSLSSPHFQTVPCS